MVEVHKGLSLGILSVAIPNYVFLGKDGQVLKFIELASFQNGGNKIITSILELLAETNNKIHEINFYICLSGPGSLTGIRTGLSPIRAWGYALNKPVFALSTMEVLSQGFEKPLLVLVPARKGEYWIQAFVDGIIDKPSISSTFDLAKYDKFDWTWVCPKFLETKQAKLIVSSPKPEQALIISKNCEAISWVRAIPHYLFDMEND